MVCGPCHAGIGALVTAGGHSRRSTQDPSGFVALHVDDDIVTPSPSCAGLGEAVAAAGVVFVRQRGLHAGLLTGLRMSSSSAATTTRSAALLCARCATRTTMGRPAMSARGFVGQARRCQACRNQHGESRRIGG